MSRRRHSRIRRRELKVRGNSKEFRGSEIIVEGVRPNEVVITSTDPSEIELKAKVFSECYNAVKNIVFTSTTNQEHLIEIVTTLMKLVETYNLKHGADKKDIVLKIINKLIDDSTLPDSNKRMLKFIPYGIIIDSIVMSANGKFGININDKCNSLFGCICK